MKELFNTYPRIWLQKSGNFKTKSKWIKRIYNINKIPDNSQIGLFYPSICGLVLNSIFDNFAFGKQKRITQSMFDSTREFKIGMVRAFFDDDGHMDKDRGPRFHQDDNQILEGLKKLLSELEIESFPIRFYMRKNKARYYFNVNQRKNYKKYYEIVGCTSKKKQKDLRNLIAK